jgi:hypothetical protein
MLSGDLAVLQAPMLDGRTFIPFALFDDGCTLRPQSSGTVDRLTRY